MIAPPKDTNSHLPSAWTAGVALLFLGIGVQGAIAPLIPQVKTEMAVVDIGDEVMVEQLDAAAPAAGAPEEVSVRQPVTAALEEIEMPPLPEVTPPLSPPEMVELIPLESIVARPPTTTPPPEAKPKADAARKSTTRSPQNGTPGRGDHGEPQLFTGNGGGVAGGRFPDPYYPMSARSEGLQGSLQLLVTVEANGQPSAVSVSSSSGHAILDKAARDHVQRRWRWPAGEVRRYIVPVKFVLQ